jgi:hypothetical protein
MKAVFREMFPEGINLMDSRDRRLGMNRAISRRDFLNGISVAIGASLSPVTWPGDRGCQTTHRGTITEEERR